MEKVNTDVKSEMGGVSDERAKNEVTDELIIASTLMFKNAKQKLIILKMSLILQEIQVPLLK